MATKTARWHTLVAATRPHRLANATIPRLSHFSTTTPQCTDGVFRDLTNMRTPIPWIDAFRRRQQEGDQKASGTHETPPKRDLTPKSMSDSYHSVILPLAQDKWLLDTYANSTGHIRLGTIFMDLDALAGVIAYKHTGEGVSTVTAGFDRITINNPLTEICDLQLSGRVTYASGRSSMEVSLQVARAPAPGSTRRSASDIDETTPEDVLLTCQCTMVSLDPQTKRPVSVPAVRTDTPTEQRLYAAGEANSAQRKDLARRSLLRVAPDDEESHLIHAMWQRQLREQQHQRQQREAAFASHHHHHDHSAFPGPPAHPSSSETTLSSPTHDDSVRTVSMDGTRLHTAAIMQPQYRNRHDFVVFGGFLLKQTFELAFCCAASAAHARPTFVSLDPSTFQNPVPVGGVLYLTATVVYTDPPWVDEEGDGAAVRQEEEEGGEGRKRAKGTKIQVRVDSRVRNVEHGETKPTGQFNYTFSVDEEVRVMPQTYTEYMMYVDGRRRAKGVLESVRQGEADGGSKERMTE